MLLFLLYKKRKLQNSFKTLNNLTDPSRVIIDKHIFNINNIPFQGVINVKY